MKNIVQIFILFILVVPAFAFTAVPDAKAACSYPGYYNSNGQCTGSYNTYQFSQYGNQYRNTEQARIASMQAYILQLIALLEQLQNLQASYTGGYGNSEVDVTTRSAQNISDDEATLRGEVDFNNSDEATVYFHYGLGRTSLFSDTTHVVLDDNDDEDFSHTIARLRDDTTYYFRAIAEDEDGRRDAGSILSFTTDDDGRSSSNDDDPEADTDDADDVEDNSAELNGSVDMNDFSNGVVFFVYGEDEDQVDDIADDYDTYSDIDEDGDDLQKVKVDSDLDGDDDYNYDISGLDDDTDYYYAICVEYEDEDDDDVITCGSTEEFTTDDNRSSSDDEPDVETGNASNIDEDSARIHGSIDMNDFNNGLVFFVYGEDENQVDDIADDYDTYSEIDEDGDDLQKIKVESDLDGDNADFYASFNGLDDDTDIYYALCVEFEDENDDEVIICGDTEDFTTDN